MEIKFINLKEFLEIVSEYDKEIPQSQTADNPMAPKKESLILVISLKRLLNAIIEWDTTWILSDSLYAWL